MSPIQNELKSVQCHLRDEVDNESDNESTSVGFGAKKDIFGYILAKN